MTRLEAACPGMVSCADILALAVMPQTQFTKGASWKVPTRRRDDCVSLAFETANLPASRDSIELQKLRFTDKINSIHICEYITNGHAIGTSACQFFKDRLYNFNTTTGNGVDPSIDPAFIPQLQALCPQNGDASRRVALDTSSPNTFDASFFKNLKSGRGILQLDQKLLEDVSTRNYAQRFLGIRGL
ncbi:hypothetical protein VitviT2T_018408 [Vitis vinifera]|uniref:peroxidase n=1 Tax=Vitis vinifera TaxID=29760 RepID=A0ABY9CXX0_VITVI|nr:hypothetical protein VitviT2T_018408 [Vitis vinifera]